MKISNRVCGLALVALLTHAAEVAGQQGRAGERPPSAAVVEALVAAIGSGDSAAVAAFVNTHMAEGLKNVAPLPDHVARFRNMRERLGQPELIGVMREPSGERVARVRSSVDGNEYLLRLGMTEDVPPKLTGIRLGPASGSGEGGVPGGAAPGSPVAGADGGGASGSALPAPPGDLNAAARRQVVDSIATLLEQLYPAPDTGAIIAGHLRRAGDAGEFDGTTDPQAFAASLTEVMQRQNGDRHLNVMPEGAGAGRRMVRPDPDAERRANYHLTRAEVLEGNIGYLRVGLLARGEAAIERLGAALTFLQDTDAMIIDLRGTPGGSTGMANALISHFTGPDIPSLRVTDRYLGETYERRTLARVPGPRRTDVPLYVLVDGRSGSAAEDVPFVLQNLGRATIVGERTGGAGRNNALIAVGHGLVASISVSRVQDPKTGREWEGVGVQPDITAPSADALDAARRHFAARSR